MIFQDDTKVERYTLPFGLILPLLMAELFWWKSANDPVILLGAIVLSYITLSGIVYAWQSISLAPLVVEIQDSSISVTMLYGRKRTFKASEIKSVRDIPWLQFVTVGRTIVVTFNSGEYLVFSREFCKVGDLLRAIRQLNQTCEFEGPKLHKMMKSP